MSNININVANKISLAEAARITGYHQDYLGQLCRGGKLRATKFGRNWFTTTDAIEDFRKALLALFEEPRSVETEEVSIMDPSVDTSSHTTTTVRTESLPVLNQAAAAPAPALTETFIVSQVDGLPIQLKTIPSIPRGANTVQQLMTNLKIQSLQHAVGDIRLTLQEVLAELSRQSAILESKPWLREGLLRSTYSGAFDFQETAQPKTINEPNRTATAPTSVGWGDWLLTGVMTGGLAVLVYSALTLQLFGSTPATTNIEYAELPPARSGMVSGAVAVPVDVSSQTPVVQAQIDQMELEREFLGPQKAQDIIGGASLGNLLQN